MKKLLKILSFLTLISFIVININATTIYYNVKQPAYAAYYYDTGAKYIASTKDIISFTGKGITEIEKPEKDRKFANFLKTNQRVILVSHNQNHLKKQIDKSKVIQPDFPKAEVMGGESKNVQKITSNASPTELSTKSPTESLNESELSTLDLSQAELLNELPDNPEKVYRTLYFSKAAEGIDHNSILAIHASSNKDYICVEGINGNLSVSTNGFCGLKHHKYKIKNNK